MARHSSRCEHCHNRFFCTPYSQQKFCSRKCRADALSVDRECRHCGGSFRIFRSRLSGKTNASGNYCSRKCYDGFLRAGSDRTRFSCGWKAARREALQRNPFCACCGTRRRLEVHHMVPWRISHTHVQDNLIPLCKRHHKLVEHSHLSIEYIDMPIETMLLYRRMDLIPLQNMTRYRLMEIARGKAAA